MPKYILVKLKTQSNSNIIQLDNQDLIKLLNYSFDKYPRQFLFENGKGQKVSDDTLRIYLRKITKLQTINFDIIRSIYITHAYNTHS